MISGLHLLQAAIVHLNQSSLNFNLTQFLSSHLNYSMSKPDMTIRLSHETKQQHPLPPIFFPQAVIKYFDVLYIGHMRIWTTQYAKQKKADDSSIIFQLNNISTFGRVCSIFSVKDGQPLLLVNYLEKTEPLRCHISSNTLNFHYEHIRCGDNSTEKSCLIEISDFIEKCVYFQPSKNISYFYRFPTLLHSS